MGDSQHRTSAELAAMLDRFIDDRGDPHTMEMCDGHAAVTELVTRLAGTRAVLAAIGEFFDHLHACAPLSPDALLFDDDQTVAEHIRAALARASLPD
jgi:hypothetical protein